MCRCDCGTTATTLGADLRKGKTVSCGCYRLECVKRPKKHGETKTRVYRTWKAMRRRCRNPKATGYKNYGGRGISVCAEWESFTVFRDWALANGYRDDLSIERINVDGNYEPANCTWANAVTQAGNRNYTKKDANGKLWWYTAQEHGITRAAFATRIFDGWPLEQAATWPMFKKRPLHMR